MTKLPFFLSYINRLPPCELDYKIVPPHIFIHKLYPSANSNLPHLHLPSTSDFAFSHQISLSFSVPNLSSTLLCIILARCFRYVKHNINPAKATARTITGTPTPTAALALVLRPVDAGAESEIAEPVALEGEGRAVRDTAPKTVGTATWTIWVVVASARCTANEPFSPQMPQSATLR